MDITASHLIGLIFIVFGLVIAIKGKISFEYGLTKRGAGHRSEFISSKQANLSGVSARIAGFLVMFCGLVVATFLSSEQILFSF